MSAQTVPERLRAWAKNRERLNLDARLLLKAADEIERTKRELDLRLTRESGLALIDEADRWEAAYRRERDRLAKVDALLADPSGSPLEAINLAREAIRQ